MKKLALFVLVVVAACGKKEDKPAPAAAPPAAAPKPTEAPPAPPPVTPPAVDPNSPTAPKADDPATIAAKANAAAAETNGGLHEVVVYDDNTPATEGFKFFKPAAGETLFNGDDHGAAWMPGAGGGGAGADEIDVAIVTSAGKSMVVFQTAKQRATLPLALSGDNLEVSQSMFEERGEHHLMVRASEINEPKFEGDTEAYLVSWDAAKHAPTIVQHWQGKTAAMPDWAVPAAD